MKRSRFLKRISSLGLIPVFGVQGCDHVEHEEADLRKEELLKAWARSEEMTLVNMEQMPPESFTFKYTDEAMTFSEQWRHCVKYTCSQLSGCIGVVNPYKDVKLPVQMPKEDIIAEIKNMYSFIRQAIKEMSDETLYSECDFAGDVIPVWRLLYALENHIIHHRGQCVVYLRLNGVVSKGYYGW